MRRTAVPGHEVVPAAATINPLYPCLDITHYNRFYTAFFRNRKTDRHGEGGMLKPLAGAPAGTGHDPGVQIIVALGGLFFSIALKSALHRRSPPLTPSRGSVNALLVELVGDAGIAELLGAKGTYLFAQEDGRIIGGGCLRRHF